MASTTLLSDNGVTSGITGYQLTGGNDGTLQLQTTTAGGTATTAMTIDSSQNVGIGTSSPGSTLDVKNTSTLQYKFGTTGGSAGFQAYTGSGVSGAMDFSYASGMIFYVSNNAGGVPERARIDSSGNLLVGTTSNASGSRAAFYSTAPSGGSNPLVRFEISTTANAQQAVFFNGNGQVGSINTSGTATSYVTSSDYRLKQDISPMTNALARVSALKPVTYKWKIDESVGEGFIAHELAEVVPNAVVGEKDAVDADGNPQYQGIDTSFLVATLTAAIQEQQALIESQAAVITTLTERITALEAK